MMWFSPGLREAGRPIPQPSSLRRLWILALAHPYVEDVAADGRETNSRFSSIASSAGLTWGVPFKALQAAGCGLQTVVDGKGGFEFATIKGETVLRETSGGRFQVKATFIEDDRSFKTVTIQRFSENGAQRRHFTLLAAGGREGSRGNIGHAGVTAFGRMVVTIIIRVFGLQARAMPSFSSLWPISSPSAR